MPSPPPPGRLIDVGGHRLHLNCVGAGAPAVIFDAALGASSLSWSLVQPRVAAITTACTYDRAGFGWSEAGPLPRTAGRVAEELHTLLERSGLEQPFVLVGHSFGGLVARLFALRHPDAVAGLILIEPAIPEDWVEPSAERRVLLARGTRLCRYGATAARTGVASVVSGLVGVGAPALARLAAKIISRGGLRREDEGVLAPIWKLSPDARELLKHMWTQRKFFEALGSQIASMPDSAADALRLSPESLRALPLTVITAADADVHRMQTDRALAAASAKGSHALAPDSGHWVPLDAPQTVVDEVLAMVRRIRNDG
jgi:pimeloyl-ACP methyl ester carboxylesterase